MQVDLDQAVEAYIAIRDARTALKAEFEKQDEALEAEQDKIDQVFLTVCNETNVNSLNTNHGTVIRQIKERFICNDWDNFRQFELDNPDYDFREKRIHQGNIKEFMVDHRDDGLPPGVSSMREFTVVVRRSTK
jgi:hypothetical protein